MASFEEALEAFMKKDDDEPLIPKVIRIAHQMVKAKKERDNKKLIKYHTDMDRVLHEFTGKEGLRPDEK